MFTGNQKKISHQIQFSAPQRIPAAHRGESGSALIAVLVMIFTAGILTTISLAISKSSTFEVRTATELQRSMYIAEGVANRAMFLLAADRYFNASETLGETDYDSFDVERFLADGIPHELNYHGTKVRFTITDAADGMDCTENNYSQSLQKLSASREDDTSFAEYLDTVSTRIKDYIDSDDTKSDNGLEKDDYEELNRIPLPRNNIMQFREELLWIPGFKRLYPTDRNGRLTKIRLIPPDGTVSLSDKQPQLLSADATMLKGYASLEDEEIDSVQEAVRYWRSERTPLSETLDPDLLKRLNNVFSRQESGFYTIVVEASPEEKRPFRRLAISLEGFSASGPPDDIFTFLEWLFF
jgi:hypothetical protein